MISAMSSPGGRCLYRQTGGRGHQPHCKTDMTSCQDMIIVLWPCPIGIGDSQRRVSAEHFRDVVSLERTASMCEVKLCCLWLLRLFGRITLTWLRGDSQLNSRPTISRELKSGWHKESVGMISLPGLR